MKRLIVDIEKGSSKPKVINETQTYRVIAEDDALSIFQGYCLNEDADYVGGPVAPIGENQGLFVFASYSNSVLKIEYDHLASHRLYSYSFNDNIIVVNNPLFLAEYLWENYAHKLELCIDAAYSMLALGYLPPPQTPYVDVFGGAPSTVTKVYFGGKMVQTKKLDVVDTDSTSFDIYEFDDMFEDALRRQLNARVASTRTFAYLSGGLDSRYVCLKLKKCGADFNTLTFGEPGCDDINIANDVSRSLGQKQINVPLVNGNYLEKIETYHINSGGLVNFLGAAHLDYAMQLVGHDCDLVFTGLMGDVVVGSYSRPFSPHEFVYSKKAFKQSLFAKNQLQGFNDATEYFFKVKAPGAVVNGDYVISDRTNSLSPFLDPIFYNYASRIPMHFKAGQKLYFQLVAENITNLAVARWQKSGIKPKNFKLNKVFSKIKWFVSGVLRRLSISTREDMNPFNNWFKNNSSLRAYYDELFENAISVIENDDLRELLKAEYRSINYRRKCNALTVLLSHKRLIDAYNR